jgi:hypothetical protein
MNCVNMHDRPALLPTPMHVVYAITQSISPLPEDIVKKIAILVNKPRIIATCRLLSKTINDIICDDNEQNRYYWYENIKLRWNPWTGVISHHLRVLNVKKAWSCNVLDGIPQLIFNYGDNYTEEKLVLKAVKVNPSYLHLGIISDFQHSRCALARHYLKTGKASWLYFAGKFETFFKDYSIQWLEQAASKGHLDAAYDLARKCIEGNIAFSDPLCEELQKGMHWLKIAANRNHSEAKVLLKCLKKGKWITPGAIKFHQILGTKSPAYFSQLLGKRTHPDQQHDLGPPRKKTRI